MFGLAGQAGWIAFAFMFHAYGLLLLEVTLTVVYAMNVYRWTTDKDGGARRRDVALEAEKARTSA